MKNATDNKTAAYAAFKATRTRMDLPQAVANSGGRLQSSHLTKLKEGEK